MSIQDWYIKEYKNDDLGKCINPTVGFMDCWHKMQDKQDFYTIIGVVDSLVRERVFSKLAEILDVDYDVIYNIWSASFE